MHHVLCCLVTCVFSVHVHSFWETALAKRLNLHYLCCLIEDVFGFGICSFFVFRISFTDQNCEIKRVYSDLKLLNGY